MINHILALFKVYKVESSNIGSLIVNGNFSLITLILKNYDYKTRKEVLLQLSTIAVNNSILIQQLISIVETDFLDNSETALKILKHSMGNVRFLQRVKSEMEMLKKVKKQLQKSMRWG